LNPPAEGFVALIWVLPVVLAITASVGVATAGTGRGRASVGEVSPEDLASVERARKRVQADHRAGSDGGQPDGSRPKNSKSGRSGSDGAPSDGGLDD